MTAPDDLGYAAFNARRARGYRPEGCEPIKPAGENAWLGDPVDPDDDDGLELALHLLPG